MPVPPDAPEDKEVHDLDEAVDPHHQSNARHWGHIGACFHLKCPQPSLWWDSGKLYSNQRKARQYWNFLQLQSAPRCAKPESQIGLPAAQSRPTVQEADEYPRDEWCVFEEAHESSWLTWAAKGCLAVDAAALSGLLVQVVDDHAWETWAVDSKRDRHVHVHLDSCHNRQHSPRKSRPIVPGAASLTLLDLAVQSRDWHLPNLHRSGCSCWLMLWPFCGNAREI